MNRKIVVYDGLFALRTVSYLIWIFCLLAAFTANAQVSVLTHHNNNDRTGANLNETLLNTTNVNVTKFGKLFSYPVDADIYTQPLYAPGVNVTGKGTHNVVYVATMNDSVYAFDADSNTGSNAQPLWQVNFTNPPNITTVPVDDVTLDTNSGNIRRFGPKSAIGIMGTPVIDLGTNTLYLVARTKETVGTGCSTNSPCYVQRLHALDIRSGAEQPGSPKTIQATGFDPRIQNQRPGLALANGVVYLAWSSHDDSGPYHGWVMGYDAATLTQTGVFNDTPSGSQGGIWQSGQPPAVDATGNLYLMTGNGSFDISTGGSNVSQSFIKLSSQTTLLDWFAQCDADIWNAANEDLNSGGVLLIPSTNLLFGGGKEGRFFLLNRGNLGHIQTQPCNTNNDSQRDTQIQQTFKAINGGGHIHGSPVYYDSPTLGKLVYVWGETDFLKAFSFNGSTFNTTPVTQSGVQAPQGMPGGFLSLSANGAQLAGDPPTGIVWAAMPYERDAENAVVQGILRAFDAVDLTKELWNSRLNFLDDLGNFAKFVPPTIANGKVYMATFNGEVGVYGLIPNPPPASEIAFVQVAATTPSQAATVAVAYPKSQFSGDLNVVVVGWNDTTSTIQSVTDTAGNTYNLAIGPTKGTKLSQSIYYAKNILGGNNTVTVQFNNTASSPDIRILEYFGVDPVSPLDVAAGASGNSNQSSSGPATITTANELLLAANTVFTSSLEAGFPFVERILTSHGDAVQDNFVNTIGTYNATAVLGSQGPWVMQMVTFRGLAPTLSVTGVSPNSGSVNGGTAVTITGTNFVSGATVNFGGAVATNVVVSSSTTITAVTPAKTAGTVDVTVTNPDAQSATLPSGFTYFSSSSSAPTVSDVSPNSGPASGSTAVTITGTNFVSGATVSFGGVAAAGVTVVNDTSITATTPAHAAGPVNVVVSNPDAQSGTLTGGFTYTSPAPTLTNVSPNTGSVSGGTDVTITGTNFVSGATVSLDGVAATGVTFVSANSITATTPAHAAGPVNVVVINPDAQSGTLTGGFTYTAPGISFVQVAAATPQSPTQTVAVTYPGPQVADDLNIVVIGWKNATSTVQSVIDSKGNSYTLAVGPTRSTGGTGRTQSIYYARNIIAGAGNNTVTVQFNQAVPYPDVRILEYHGVNTMDVTRGASGNSSTASSGSVTTTSANELIFGANTVATSTAGPGTGYTSRIITSPNGDIAEDRIVTSTGTYSATAPLSSSGRWVMQIVTFKPGSSSPAPVVSGVAPNSGPAIGGTAVTITGTNFVTGATVTLGGTAATGVTVVNATTITATTPAHAAGSVNVVVTNPDTQSGTLTNGFTYNSTAPTVASVSPNSGLSTGGTAVTITGTNFVTGATVTLGGTAATGVTVANATTITATTPAHAAGSVNVVVTNPDAQSGTLTNGFTYASTVQSISFVQVAAATPQSPTQTVAVPYTGVQTAGDLNVIVVGWNDTTATVQSVQDSAGNVYSLAIGPTSGTGLRQSIYYASNVNGGVNTVTVTFSQPAVYPDIRVLEYRGVTTLDVTAGASGSGTTANSGAATTTTANELIFGANTVSTGTNGPGTGFTSRIITTPDSDIAEDRIVTSTGAYSATAPLSSSGYWIMQMVTFK